jgi:AcrR family transcriptional regulator
MSKLKRRPIALEPCRRPGKLRVASLMAAAAEVIAERGYEAATMAEIAARAGAHIGSLYHFFPNKEVLADALLRRYGEILDAAFAKIEDRASAVSIGELADMLVGFMVELHSESQAILALLDARAELSAKREELCDTVLLRIARILRLRAPELRQRAAESMAVVLLNNMRTNRTWTFETDYIFRPGALPELREMNRLYLEKKLAK